MKEEKLGWARGLISRLPMYYNVLLAFLMKLPDGL